MLGLTIPLMLLARWSHEVVLLGGVTVIVKTRLRGWAYRTRTAESVREPPNWFCVTISPKVGVSPAAESSRTTACCSSGRDSAVES